MILQDEIDVFIDWAFKDPQQRFYKEAFAPNSDSCIEIASEEFDHYQRLILQLQAPACRGLVRRLVGLAQKHCDNAPLPSVAALDALGAAHPRLALSRQTTAATG